MTNSIGKVIPKGTRVRIPKGATIRGTFPGPHKIAKRSYVVTVFTSTPVGYEKHGTPYITWVGAHGYWHDADIADVEVLEDSSETRPAA